MEEADCPRVDRGIVHDPHVFILWGSDDFDHFEAQCLGFPQWPDEEEVEAMVSEEVARGKAALCGYSDYPEPPAASRLELLRDWYDDLRPADRDAMFLTMATVIFFLISFVTYALVN